MIKIEDFYAVLQISHLVLSFFPPAFRLRAPGAVSRSVTKTLHITTNLLLRRRDHTVPGTALLPGLDLLEVGTRGGFSAEGSHHRELLLCAVHSPRQ